MRLVTIVIFAVVVAGCSGGPSTTAEADAVAVDAGPTSLDTTGIDDLDAVALEVYENRFAGIGEDPFADSDEVFRSCIADADLPKIGEDSEDPAADQATAVACMDMASGQRRAVDDALMPFFRQLRELLEESLEESGIDVETATADEMDAAADDAFTEFDGSYRDDALASIREALESS